MPLLLATALALTPACAASAPPPPDVVLIVVDTLRADHLGCYGYPRPTSPRIDALAARGVLFRAALAQSNWTLPSVASLMTSLYPSQHRALAFPPSPQEARGLTDQRTLAGLLAERGYHTAAFTCGPFLRVGFGLDHGFEEYIHGTQTAEQFRRMIVPWLGRQRRKPFFLYVHLQDVHSPYGKDGRGAERWDPGYSGPADGSTPYLEKASRGEVLPSKADMRHLLALYDGDISSVDGSIGAILGELDRLGLRDRAVVIVTADHGESFREHGARMFHGTSPYEEELRVPLLMAGPGLPRGEVAAPVQLIDVMPTLLELLGLPVPAQAKGRSLIALIAHPSSSSPVIFSEPSSSGGRDPRALIAYEIARIGSWKLIHPLSGGSDEVYDLSADPGERRDLAKANPGQAARLRDSLSRWKSGAGTAARKAPLSAIPAVPDQRSRLGY